MRGTWVLGLLISMACDSNDPSSDAGKDAGADAGQDSGQDAGQDAGQDSGANDYGELPTDPILERTPDLQYDCAQKLAVTRQVGRSWNGYGSTFSVIESGGSLLFGRVERAGDPFAPPTSVDAFLSTVSPADGTFGAPVEIDAASFETTNAVGLAAMGNSVLYAYADQSGAHVAVVTGTTIVGPKPVLSPGGTPMHVKIATSGDRGAVLLAVRGLDDRISYLLQAIDSTGGPVGSSYEVVRGARAYVDTGANIVATAGGYAVAWRDTKTDAGEIYFRLFGMDGQPAGDAKTIFMGDENQVGYSVGFDAASVALLPIGNEFLVGWVESQPGDFNTNTGAYAMVVIAKLDADGDHIGEPALLRSVEPDLDHVEPELFWFGDKVAVAWGRGDHIYICAGCVPNHSMRLVLIDPARMIPVSEVAEIDDASGGILYRSTAAAGADILSAFRIVYHVTNESALAAFTCTAR